MIDLFLGTRFVSSLSKDSRLIAFPSKFGWVALLVVSGKLSRLEFGASTKSGLCHGFAIKDSKADSMEIVWVELISRYLNGEIVDLSQIPIDLSWATSFQRQVFNQCRNIPIGATLTYGHLAAKAGSPNASRAVGTVMAINRVPIVVPCHRVVPAKGIGNYSAGNGVETKKKLLQMEGVLE